MRGMPYEWGERDGAGVGCNVRVHESPVPTLIEPMEHAGKAKTIGFAGTKREYGELSWIVAE